MILQLVHIEIKIATEPIRDDSFQVYVDRNNALRKLGRSTSLKNINDIVLIVKHKKGIIEIGAQYVYREFVDENGEVFYLNSNPEMDKICIKNELYPKIINKHLCLQSPK